MLGEIHSASLKTHLPGMHDRAAHMMHRAAQVHRGTISVSPLVLYAGSEEPISLTSMLFLSPCGCLVTTFTCEGCCCEGG